MNTVLARWNALDADTAAREALPCCGSHAWAAALASRRPILDESSLLEASRGIWQALPQNDWQEAFESHPRIGQNHPQKHATKESLRWSAEEQRTALSQDDNVRAALAEANRRYEEKFGRIFIICASGKTADEILGTLETRIENDPAIELREAAEQQCRITELRLRRWMEQN
jgi:2-oxo-4-hydroxy-4-carboxy-5-ureidoimidazoline decarboxylase